MKQAFDRIEKRASPIFKSFFSKKKRNTQPENARIAHRAVKFAKLAELYGVSLSDKDAAELAGRISEVPDWKLNEAHAGSSAIVGCPANIIPLFAGYSRRCTDCPYFARDHTGGEHNYCALNEKE